jgi:hypothetical protein
MTDQPAPHPHSTRVGQLFQHAPTSRLSELRSHRPNKVEDEHVGLNGKVALIITASVGTMWAAYIFAIIAFVSLPAAVISGNLTVIIAWISSNFIQLVLLPVIIVGQNIQGRASDKRAIETYKDAEAILHECMQLQAHLQAQDKVLDDVIARVQKLAS